MKINKELRILVAERKVAQLTKENKECNPYGYKDCYAIYCNLEYWEELLLELNN